jgi:hypothetical protein
MRLARTATMIGLAVLMSGCMTAEQRRAADEERCLSYGFRPRTDAFAECLQRLDLFRRAELRQDTIYDPWSRPVVVIRP